MQEDRTSKAACWLALYVQVRHEARVEKSLADQNIECFLPRYKSLRAWKDRRKLLHLPLFPGYLFCRPAAAQKNLVLGIPGVIRIVSGGGKPVPVDEEELRNLQKTVGAELPFEPVPFIETGERVVIESGPLRGASGFLLCKDEPQRVVLSISLLQRAVAVDVRTESVRRLPSAGPRGACEASFAERRTA